MIPVLINNPLFRGITPEKLSANLEEISFHTRSYKKGEILARQGDVFCGYRQTLLDKPDKLFFLKDSDLFPVGSE